MTVPTESPDALLRLFSPDSDVAREQLAQLTQKLVRFFEWRQCEGADDLAQECLLRGWRRLQDGIELHSPLEHYFFGVARNLVSEARRSQRRGLTTVSDAEPADTDGLRRIDTMIELRQALTTLSQDERRLLTQYHLGDKTALQTEMGVTAVALRVRVHRLHQRVRRHLTRYSASWAGATESRDDD